MMREFRKNFGRIQKIIDVPNLIDIQMKSYEKFLQKDTQLEKRLSPDDPTIEDHLGDLEERRGDLAKARERWSRALALEPEDGGAAIRAKLERTAAAAKQP